MPGLPREVLVEPGHRVVHVAAGPYDLPKEALADELDAFTAGVLDHLGRRPGRRRRPRQLLAERRRRPPPQARPRRAARVDVPHAGPGQGRGRRPRAGVARPGRGRGHRLQRRDLRQLPGGGAPVPPPLRRPGRAHRDRPAGRRARLLRARRSDGRAARRRAARRPAGDPVRRAHPAAEGARRGHPGPRRAATAPRRRARHRRRRQRRRRRRRGRRGPARWSTSSGVADRVRFVAPQPHHILSSYYRAADRRGRAEPQRELRARRPRGRGVRHPGRRQRGRRAAQHRPRRRHRACSSRAATRTASPGRSPRSSTIPAARRRWAPPPRCGPGASRGASRPPACAGCTPTSPTQPAAPARGVLVTSARRPGSTPMTDVHDDAALAVLERRIDEWLASIAAG